MLFTIDFNSEEAYYVQLKNQIILGIATAALLDGESLPSVREMAENIGINMHTVNKTYSVLKQEGYIKLDRRRGAFVSVKQDSEAKLEKLKAALRVSIAEAQCSGLSPEDIHAAVDECITEMIGGANDAL